MQSNRDNRNPTGRFKFIKMNARFFLLNPLNEQIRLFTIPISLGLMYISYQKFIKQNRKENRSRRPVTCAEPNLVSDIEVSDSFC